MIPQTNLLTISTLLIASQLFGWGAIACGSGSGRSSNGGLSQATGGTSSGSPLDSTGGAGGTGGFSVFDPSYCNGQLYEIITCGYFHLDIDVGPDAGKATCTIQLNESPPDPKLEMLYIDCSEVSLVPKNQLDAGSADGFVIDYDYEPAHLVLLGSACDAVLLPARHTIDLLEGCRSVDN